MLIYRFLTGSLGTNILDASAGIGGNGGNGFGTGAGGHGGDAGGKGRISILNLATATTTEVFTDNTTVPGGAATGLTGGTGATPASQQLNL